MAIKAIVTKLDEAPEALREHYTERDGKFFLSVDAVEGFSLEDVTGLKAALGKERTERERFEGLTTKFKDLDPDKVRTALTELEALKAIDPTKEADKLANTKFESAKAQLVEKHTGEITERDQRINTLTKTVEELLIDAVATGALAEAKGAVDLLLPHVRANTRVKEVDGKMTVEVVDKAGNVRIADGKGTPMDISGLVAEMRQSEAFARAFEGGGQSGTGKEHDAQGGKSKADFGGSRIERQAAIAQKYKLPAT